MNRRIRPRAVGFLVATVLGGALGAGPSSAAATPPTATVTAPTTGQIVPLGPVPMSGSASDDAGVASVVVGIQDRDNRLWWHRDGTWGAWQAQKAALGAPGARTTSWTYTWPGPGRPGRFTLSVIPRDVTGVQQPPPRARVPFEVQGDPPPPPPPTDRPNILLILSDDQRADTLWAMPEVNSRIADRGVTFDNGFVPDPLCCPSRASLLTGAYPHTTGVYGNGGGPAGYLAFEESSTIATWLNAGGYRTGYVGKYLNGYRRELAAHVPPGWDRWVAFASDKPGGADYYNYTLSVDGTAKSFGSTPASYATDVLRGYAESFVTSAPADEPLFLVFAPYAPHQPATPAPRHTSAFPDLEPHRPASYDEADVSDKPAYIRNMPRITATMAAGIDAQRRRQLQSLLAVDEAVAGIMDTLDDAGRLANTMVVYTSDNGFSWGEHRWGQLGFGNKQAPYEENIKVPFLIRYDPLAQPGIGHERLVVNIDLAPTFAELAGVPAPGVDGRSLVPLLDGSATGWRQDFLVEKGDTGEVPSYCAVRTTTHAYMLYKNAEEELYDLIADPAQMQSRHADPAYATIRTALRQRLKELCLPPPPGVIPPD